MKIRSRELLILTGLWTALSATTLHAEPVGVEPCDYDRKAMLQLDPNMFDQDDTLGWRKLGNRTGCKAEAADAIAFYIEVHREELTRQWQMPSFKWHEAQMRAMAGETLRAVQLMRKSVKPEKGPDAFKGWTEYALPWNEYVKATIAFLERDLDALKKARDRLSASPLPADFAELDRSQVGGKAPAWPQNLDVVDRLIACFGRPYEEAYGSPNCRAVGQRE